MGVGFGIDYEKSYHQVNSENFALHDEIGILSYVFIHIMNGDAHMIEEEELEQAIEIANKYESEY